MEIRRGITELLEAIPDRIEVSGQAPTWKVTGGSFESVVDYANEAFDEPVVLAREDRTRWWPRVTLTVAVDAALAASAPPLSSLAGPAVPRHRAPEASYDEAPAAAPNSTLDDIFAHQEELRLTRLGAIPSQREPSPADPA